LGHIIYDEGIAVDPENIEAIKGWKTPKNVIEVRFFMGLDGSYRILISCFLIISHPVTSLQRKGVKFQWTIEYEKGFQQLKKLLKNAPISRIANPNEYFVVCTYVCKEGL
jgi:hypothetical protein